VYTACGVVLKPSASDGFEMEGSEALYLANYAQAGAVGGKQPNWQTHFNTCTNSGGDVQKDQVTHPEPYDHDFRFCLNSALQLHERRIA
jgi:hypothetical protein